MREDFRDRIPFTALRFENTDGMVSVLDGLYNFKKDRQNNFFRVYNTITNQYRSHLVRTLVDYGFPRVSEKFPSVLLQNMVLNAGKIMSYRGSVTGIKLFLQACTLGEVTLDTDNFFPRSRAIYPDDPNTGFLPNDIPEDAWYTYSPDEESLNSEFKATIETYWFENLIVKDYIRKSIKTFLPFYESDSEPEIIFLCGPIVCVENMIDYFNCLQSIKPLNSCLVDDISSLEFMIAQGYTI